MSDEKQLEVLPAKGPFGNLPGPGPGRPKNSLNRFTKAMREEGAEQIRALEVSGTPANPIKAMLHVLEKAYEKNDLELMLRAAIAVADRYLPTKSAVEIDIPDAEEAELKQIQIQAVLARWQPRELRDAITSAN